LKRREAYRKTTKLRRTKELKVKATRKIILDPKDNPTKRLQKERILKTRH